MIYSAMIFQLVLIILLFLKNDKRSYEKILLVHLCLILFQFVGLYLFTNGFYQNKFNIIIIYLRVTIAFCHGPLFYLYFSLMRKKVVGNIKIIIFILPVLIHFSSVIYFILINDKEYLIHYCNLDKLSSAFLFFSGKIYFLVSAPFYYYYAKPDFSKNGMNRYYTLSFIVSFVFSLLGLILNAQSLLFVVLRGVAFFTTILALRNPFTIHSERIFRNKRSHLPQAEELEKLKNIVCKEISKFELYLDKDITLNTLVNRLNISQPVLSHIFNFGNNKGFPEYINRLRLSAFIDEYPEQARNYTIEAVAIKCGFSSKATFYRSFKSEYNCSPKEFFRKVNKYPNKSS